jgi:hypothetical protein
MVEPWGFEPLARRSITPRVTTWIGPLVPEMHESTHRLPHRSNGPVHCSQFRGDDARKIDDDNGRDPIQEDVVYGGMPMFAQVRSSLEIVPGQLARAKIQAANSHIRREGMWYQAK